MEDGELRYTYTSKFKLGQDVYYIHGIDIRKRSVISITFGCYGPACALKEPQYTLKDGDTLYEHNLFGTADEAKNYLIDNIRNKKVEG